MRKHVLFIIENTSVYNDTRVRSEALAAKEFGFDVSVICPKARKRKFRADELDGIRVYEHPEPVIGVGKLSLVLEYVNAFFWELVLALRIYFGQRFHIIHSANPPDHVFLLAIPFRLLGVRFIFDHHDITPETYIAKFGKKGLVYKLLLMMESLTFRSTDVVISTNESYKKIAMGRGGRHADDVFVVRNGPDLGRMKRLEANGDLRRGFSYLVGYVGIISQQEGIDVLLRVARYLVMTRGRTDIRFIIVGSGPYWKEMVELSRRMSLERYVSFTGFVPDADLYNILSSVDVCVNPEFRNEFTDKSTMIKIMEYMTFGKPVVQFYTTEGQVTAGEAAVYVRENSEELFGDALLELLEDEPKRKAMGAEATARIQNFLCWEKQKDNLKRAYDRISSIG